MKATGAYCPIYRIVFDYETCLFWHWSKSQAMHERGTGHKMQRFNHREIDLPKLAYDGVLQKL